MSGKVGLPAAGADAPGQAPRRSVPKVRPVPQVESTEETSDADLRLIIEETGDPVELVYTLVDRKTGQIVKQFRREEMLRRQELGDYAAGDGFSVKA
jgi:hypothetical protein